MRSRPRRGLSTSTRALAGACALVTLSVLGLACAPLVRRADVMVGTASATGIYDPLGASICRLVNLDASRHGLRCAEEPSSGSAANIASLRRGRLDLGIVPSDVLADAVAKEPTPELRVLFAGPGEMLTVVAREELGIRTLLEARGRRINVGTPGSRQRATIERVLESLGLRRSDFTEVRELPAAEQSRAFCAETLDVIVFAVGHPDGLIRDVTRTCHGRLVDVSGPAVERVLSESREYERAVIRGGTYPGNPVDIRTFGVRAVVVAGHAVSDTVAYEVTRAVFENFDAFRRLHPTFESLSIADMVRASGSAPVHPGALRYYREHGWSSPTKVQ